MTKLFASDFDGTLYFHNTDEPVRAADLAAIEAFQDAGGLFGACTGRPVRGLTVQSWGLVPFDFYIALSGATLHDRDLDALASDQIPRDQVRRIYDEYEDQAASGVVLVCAADDYWCIGHELPEWPVGTVADFDDLPYPTQGVSMDVATEEVAARLARMINRDYVGIATCHTNLASIDVVPYGHTKGTGLRAAAGRLGATLTAGIGDGLNDLPLLEAADVAYTFRTADPALRAAADVLVDSVAEALADFMSR